MCIKDTSSGCNKLVLYIVISKVRNINLFDRLFVKFIKKIFFNHPSVELREIYFKDNLGRDFSSYHTMFKKVRENKNQMI